MRSRLPSCTLTCTRSVSPGSKRGNGRSAVTLSIWAWPSVSRMFIASVLSLLFVCLRGRPTRPQIGPPLPRDLLPLPRPPFGDLAVVPRNQDLRHAPLDPVRSGPRRRPRVVRILQQSVLETLLVARLGRAHHAGQQPYATVHHHHRRDLAAREHEVADRNLFQRLRLDHPLVDALEPAADQDHPRSLRQLP